ncbi:MAG: hypothetical protein Q9209_002898 [Squamulea sp. 1 TL-2023]
MTRSIAAGRGANAPVNGTIIGQPRLISSSLGPSLNDVPDRPLNYEARTLNGPPNNSRDPELLEQRMNEIYRRMRILCDDSRFRHLDANVQSQRSQFLGWYRTNEFLNDLAAGHHDGFAAALDNQEHDSYYSELWKRMSHNSWKAAQALRERINPHRKPRIALTVPPRYHPSDLPAYTATESPPNYSAHVPEGHVARDVPLCTARDCPLRILGIEHSLGLYHHNGQVGPKIHPEGNYLPSFGGSNPPPNVWDAYNHLVLDVNTDYQAKLVKAFIRYHDRPWTPQTNTSCVRKHNSAAETKKKPLSELERWTQDQIRRIPCYSYDAPRARRSAAELHGFEEERDIDFETRLSNALDARRSIHNIPNEPFENIIERHALSRPNSPTHQHADYATGHRHGSVRVHTTHVNHGPVHLPGIAEVVDQLVPAPLFAARAERVNQDIVDEAMMNRYPWIRFADEVSADANAERSS